MKRIILTLAVFTLLFALGCQKPLDQVVDDLGSTDAKIRQEAIDRLGKEGESVAAQLASALSSEDAEKRKAIFQVMIRLGDKALPEMVKKISYAFNDKSVREGFTDYFRSLGDKGYNALMEELMGVAEAEANEFKASGSIAKLGSMHHQFEALSLVLESLDNNLDVARVPELLEHPYGKVRTRAAYLLCMKNWQPSSPQSAMIYYTHLIATLECPNATNPVDDAAQMANGNFKLFLETEQKFPAGGNARYQVLAATGSDEVAQYLYDQAKNTDNEFLQLNYFSTLAQMHTDLSLKLAQKLLSDPVIGKSLQVLDPNAKNAVK